MSQSSPLQEAIALAGVRQFLTQSRHAQTPELLLLAEIGGITGAKIESAGAKVPVIGFDLTDTKGGIRHCRCNPAAFATLLLVVSCGQSVFIDHANGRPYVKVFGRKAQSAGTVFARIIAEALEGEDFTYANGDTLDLRAENIAFRCNNPRTANELTDSLGDLLGSVATAPDHLFGGSPAEKHKDAFALVDLALSRLHEEHEEAVKA